MAQRGRGRGRGRGRDKRDSLNIEDWVPKSSIGKKVKGGEITSIEEIYELGKPILEPEIVDFLLPTLQSETLDIKNTQRMTDCGRKAQFRAVVLIGDKNGHFGIGTGKSEEVRPAIETATRDARRRMVCVPRGSGSWEDTSKTPHSIPITVTGKNGSVEVTIKPAPRGVGLAANPIVRKVLTYAGVKNAWSFSRGHTRNIYNMAMAAANALNSLNSMKYHGDWSEMGAKGEEVAKIHESVKDVKSSPEPEKKKKEENEA
ncbi:MAG: 30S ribosomal protein S5 [Candidatus Micrarchaeota archaeon]